MSNSKSAIKEIKNLMVQFGFLKNDEIELLSFKLEDDTILNAAKLGVGEKIFKINEAFEQVILEDGSYKLKENFDIEVKAGEIVAVKEIFVDAKLVDGTVLKIAGDAIAEGAKVMVVTADAEVPAPDGEHELEGGDKIQTKNGVIVKYTEVGPEEVGPEKEAPEAPSIDKPMGMDQEMMSMLKDFITNCSAKMKEMEGKYSSLQNEFNSFKKEPAAKKISDGKAQMFGKDNKDDILDARVKALHSLKNK
jgi:hypothetical protein